MSPYTHPGISKPPATVEALCTIASRITGIEQAAIKGKSRQKNIVFARHLVMWAAKRYSKLSLGEIASPFLKDHCSAMHANRKIESLRFTKDKEFYKVIKAFDGECRERFTQYK